MDPVVGGAETMFHLETISRLSLLCLNFMLVMHFMSCFWCWSCVSKILFKVYHFYLMCFISRFSWDPIYSVLISCLHLEISCLGLVTLRLGLLVTKSYVASISD